MNYEKALRIYGEIGETKLKSLKDGMIKCAIEYARIRTVYFLVDLDEKTRMEGYAPQGS